MAGGDGAAPPSDAAEPFSAEPFSMALSVSCRDDAGGSACWPPPDNEASRPPPPTEVPVPPSDGVGGTALRSPTEIVIPFPPATELGPPSDAGGGITDLAAPDPVPDNEATRAPPVEVPDPIDGGGGTTAISRPDSELERPTPESPFAALRDGAGDIAVLPDNESTGLFREKLPTPSPEGAGGTTGKSTPELSRPFPGNPEACTDADGITTTG
jgi:hypothetical protein